MSRNGMLHQHSQQGAWQGASQGATGFRFGWRRTALAAPAAAVAALVAGAALRAAPPQPPTLVTGKNIQEPPKGKIQQIGSLPMNVVLSPGGGYAITTDMGFHQDLSVIRLTDGSVTSRLTYGDPTSASKEPSLGLYYGLAFGAEGLLYAAQGNNDTIAVLSLSNSGQLTQVRTIKTRTGDFPSGLATDLKGRLYVANNDPSATPEPFITPSSLAIYNRELGTEVGRFSFKDLFGINSPNYPLAVAALADGSKCYVSSQRDAAVYVLDTHDPANITQLKSIPTGSHPIALLLDKAQKRLFVANAHSDTVSIIDTASDTITNTILLRPERLRSVAGVTPTNLSLSPDEKVLYVSLGDLNAVAAVSLHSPSHPTVGGYIPAGWYPTGAVTDTSGRHLLVINAKGNQTRYPNPGYQQYQFNDNPQYDLNLIRGTSQLIAVPNVEQLKAGTTQALKNAGIAENGQPAGVGKIDDKTLFDHRLDAVGLKAGKIKHVIYIIKENRTYDQVLGDLPQGNGDKNLALFGRDVTPNLHALAERFVLLDNFYVCAEASGDGWPWSTQSIANEYVIKNLPYNYSNRGRNYDFEGQNNGYPVGGFPAKDPDGKTYSDAFPNGAPPIADVAEGPGGHIWDLAVRAGLSYRNYGFFYTFGVTVPTGSPGPLPAGATIIPDNYPASKGIQPPGHDLAGASDFDFRRYDAAYADSDAPSVLGAPLKIPTYGKHKAVSRFSEWNTEFKQQLAKDPAGGAVPAFQTVRFMNDHTQGMSPGNPSPKSHVADNDYACGQLIEALSNSPIWESTLVCILEDDAQDGPDHVDCHRSPAYVISPWIKKGSVDHEFHNTDGMLKTMEMILGLPPMSNYDAVANPILDFDKKPSNNAPFKATLPAKEIIAERNPTVVALERSHDPKVQLAKMSEKMDLEHPDSAPDRQLNEVLWKSIKGMDSEMPEPRRVRPTLLAEAKARTGAKTDANAGTKAAGERTKDDDDDD